MAGGGGEARFRVSAETLDVEAYASRYKGRTRLVRLLFIAERCGVEEKGLQALRMAHDEARERGNTLLYREAALRINGRLGPRYGYDDAGVDRLVGEVREPAATCTCPDCSDSGDASSSSASPAWAPREAEAGPT